MTGYEIPPERDLPAGRLSLLKDDLMAQIEKDIEDRSAAAPTTPTDGRRPRRWPKVAVATVAGVLMTSGAAAALGVLPEPVESTLREFREWGFEANQGAERMATTTDGDMTYEVWRVPLDGGGQCVYERVIGLEGDDDQRGSSSCSGASTPPRSRDDFPDVSYPFTVFDNSTGADPESAPLHDLGSGRLPIGATSAVFEFEDGTTLTVEAQREGYFITTFPGVDNGLAIVEVRAVAPDGRVVGTNLPGEPPPQPPPHDQDED